LSTASSWWRTAALSTRSINTQPPEKRVFENAAKEEVLASLKTAFAKFPKTKGAIPAITVDYTISQSDYAFTSPLDGAIKLNGGMFKNIGKLKDT
jgi:hypothetical protein